jgi:hypothetical protein
LRGAKIHNAWWMTKLTADSPAAAKIGAMTGEAPQKTNDGAVTTRVNFSVLVDKPAPKMAEVQIYGTADVFVNKGLDLVTLYK